MVGSSRPSRRAEAPKVARHDAHPQRLPLRPWQQGLHLGARRVSQHPHQHLLLLCHLLCAQIGLCQPLTSCLIRCFFATQTRGWPSPCSSGSKGCICEPVESAGTLKSLCCFSATSSAHAGAQLSAVLVPLSCLAGNHNVLQAVQLQGLWRPCGV